MSTWEEAASRIEKLLDYYDDTCDSLPTWLSGLDSALGDAPVLAAGSGSHACKVAKILYYQLGNLHNWEYASITGTDGPPPPKPKYNGNELYWASCPSGSIVRAYYIEGRRRRWTDISVEGALCIAENFGKENLGFIRECANYAPEDDPPAPPDPDKGCRGSK